MAFTPDLCDSILGGTNYKLKFKLRGWWGLSPQKIAGVHRSGDHPNAWKRRDLDSWDGTIDPDSEGAILETWDDGIC